MSRIRCSRFRQLKTRGSLNLPEHSNWSRTPVRERVKSTREFAQSCACKFYRVAHLRSKGDTIQLTLDPISGPSAPSRTPFAPLFGRASIKISDIRIRLIYPELYIRISMLSARKSAEKKRERERGTRKERGMVIIVIR